jgi:hypothetical protein
MYGSVVYLLWSVLDDVELEDARAAMADLADEDLRVEAAMRRSETLRAIGSEASFFSGLARIDGEFRSVLIVDEKGNEVADQLINPIRELETPEEERYAVLLKRHDASGVPQPVSFLFLSGEPALECRDRYRRLIGPHA